jgi:hypothetical protein
MAAQCADTNKALVPYRNFTSNPLVFLWDSHWYPVGRAPVSCCPAAVSPMSSLDTYIFMPGDLLEE